MQQDKPTLAEILGANLRAIRLKLKEDQREFGRMLGLPQSSVSALESAKMSCTLKTLEKISSVLKVSAAKLLTPTNGRCGGK
jgi:transcriptional regulator with XRE-family HTH domain